MKVNEFVSQAKSLITQFTKIRVVIGNQSADLDSIASAISMSYYLNNNQNADTKTPPVSQNTTHHYFPIINSTKSILQSKKECLYFFETLAINLDDLIFLNDLAPTQTEITHLYLVDHHELDDGERLSVYKT